MAGGFQNLGKDSFDITEDEMVYLATPNYTEGIYDNKFIDNLYECLGKIASQEIYLKSSEIT